MPSDTTIHVHHTTRVEGHGDIHAEIVDGVLKQAQFAIVEAPRFFEGFLRGQRYDDVCHVASRICGICACSHKCAALKATEVALAVSISPQTEALRRLCFHGEVLSSHLLHIYFLAAPDFLGLPSVMPLIGSDPELVRRAMRLKQVGYDLAALVAGRHTHPVAMTVGGFSFLLPVADLEPMRARLVAIRADLDATVELFATIELPDFERPTEYVSLKHPERYAFYDGDIFSSEGHRLPVRRYREAIQERVVPYSTAKHARWNRPQYMVGALARLNNNYEQLHPAAKETARRLGMSPPVHNPFAITLAQLVECVHCVEDAIELIDELTVSGIHQEHQQAPVQPRAGHGAGAVEAPRGMLLHEYEFDEEGRCLAANHVIPTAQNLGNLEADMREYVPRIAAESSDRITRKLEMLVRAYDPCISCSAHMVRLRGG
ncbi:MAG: Ni/Fe hydrogenase subunit alpha [Armatimonadota bacterium]